MPNNASTESSKHPYLRVEPWESGALIFWRNNNYSKEQQALLDLELRKWIDSKRANSNRK